jgi:hypothetical protein
VDALYFAGVGAREEARRAARRGLAIQPEAAQLEALERALDTGEGPLDVTPFVVGPAG